jgi:acetamidase/formamidase
MWCHPDYPRTRLSTAVRQNVNANEAYTLTSVAVDVDITQLVDGNVGVHAMCPKNIFK